MEDVIRKKSDRSGLFAGAAILVLSIIILRLPLFNYLGYEFSVAIALLQPFVSWYLAVRMFQPRKSNDLNIPVSEFKISLGRIIARSFAILLLPALAATMNILFVKNCSFGEGLLYYSLIPAVTSLWSTAMASFCIIAFRKRMLIYSSMLFAVLCYPLYIGYYSPQIYSYNFIYGYFSGFSYDETLHISIALILFRFLTLVIALLAVLSSILILRRRNMLPAGSLKDFFTVHAGTTVPIIVIGILLCCGWWYRYTLRLETSTDDIRSTLGAEFRTEHFRIIYSRATFSDEEIKRVGATHEFRFHQVTDALQISFHGTIASYIYPSEGLKRRFIGTGNTNIAKPWRKEIHLNADAWEGTLKHELVHVIAGEAGMPVIKAHYNIGLTEGLATAIDDEFGNRTLHEYAAAMLRFGIVADPVRLIKPAGFAFQSSSVSYVMMGSFCRFLIDRYGILRLKELYGGASVEKIYGKTYEQLIDEWQRFLERIAVPESWRKHIEYYFRRPSIFAKECAHAIANLNEEGGQLLDQHQPLPAEEKFRTALMMSWNTESYGGLIRSFFTSERYDSVVASMNIRTQDSLHRPGIANLFLIYADALWHQHDPGAARNLYSEILSLDLSERYDEAAAIRLRVSGNGLLRDTLKDMFGGSVSDSAAAALLQRVPPAEREPLVAYLKAKISMRQRNFAEAIKWLESILLPLDNSTLDARKEELLGESCFMLNRFQEARMHFWKSLNFVANGASIMRVNDRIEQCEWFENCNSKVISQK